MTKDELKNNIIQAIDQYSDISREYELNLTNIVNSGFDIVIAEDLLKELMENNNDIGLSYAVFYCVNIYHRNLFNTEKLSTIWEKYSASFNQFHSIDHLDVNRFRVNLTSDTDYNEQYECLKKALQLSQKYRNAGYLHSFSALFIAIVELNEKKQDIYNKLLKEWRQQALKSVDAAIVLDDTYAIYYSTKGRILSVSGEYDSADKEIRMAIAKENSRRKDYAVRIGHYQYYRLQNQLRQQHNAIKQEEESINVIKNSIVSNIETIALFSGIISFILGSLSLAKDTSTVQAGLLIVTLMGCLSAVFATFTLLLHAGNNTYKKSTAIIVIITSVLISVGALVLSGVFEC